MLKSRRCDIGRWYSGDINGKFWFGVQKSNAADRFGVTGHQPEELYYYFDGESLPSVYQELSKLATSLGNNLGKLCRFFEENTTYTDEKVAEYLKVELDVAKKLLKDYADFELGLEIAEAVRTTGQCEFTAEL